MSSEKRYRYVDYFSQYDRIMQFNKNKSEPIHRWYPFVEGYSKDFISSILDEYSQIKQGDITCLEPFSGSGTTALELQEKGYKCYSFEVNPFMALLGRVKLENGYDVVKIEEWFLFVKKRFTESKTEHVESVFPTLYENDKKERWNYSKESGIAVEKIKKAIQEIDVMVYRELFTVALAAILLDVSNLYRNGKCLSYKKDWKERKLTQQEVFDRFAQKIEDEIIVDLQEKQKGVVALVNNKKLLNNCDSRIGIEEVIDDNSIDLVVTSPPYLNSRDYTDSYMLELKTLDFVKKYDDVMKLRKKTLRSHVQIKWSDTAQVENELLQQTLLKLEKAQKKSESWNDSIISMVRLYFVDINSIFEKIFPKLKKNGRIYFNVSDSAYFGVLIKTLEICASLAENIGYKVVEIRQARYLKTSPQQKEKVRKLLEGIIVLQKE